MYRRPTDVKQVMSSWYSGKNVPFRIGVYKREAPSGTSAYSLWDGNKWGRGHPTIEAALLEMEYAVGQSHARWRGQRINNETFPLDWKD